MPFDLTPYGIELREPRARRRAPRRRRNPWLRGLAVMLLCSTALLVVLPITDQARLSFWGAPSGLRPSDLRARFESIIEHYARWYGLDPALLAAVIQVESSFNPFAVSPKGALGLMQLMPETALSWQVADPMNPSQNIRGGALQLRYLLVRFNDDLELALAAYHAGETRVSRHEGIPPLASTQQYVDRVLDLYRGLQVSAERDL
ncbi:MAG TPA: lytic transglycosylase domain-containing protein [Nitrospiraceae bacterium]|nr:lytic transglycosylase domain-containing protein [Nitrospiraceae bacterium]